VTFLSSVWPAMACSSHHVIRGFLNDVETATFWLAADATNMPDSDDINRATQDGEETTWKGRLVWTVHTEVLETAPSTNRVGEDLWRCGRLRVLTSAPRSMGGKSRILFDPLARQEETGNVRMLVLDFAGVPLWQ